MDVAMSDAKPSRNRPAGAMSAAREGDMATPGASSQCVNSGRATMGLKNER